MNVVSLEFELFFKYFYFTSLFFYNYIIIYFVYINLIYEIFELFFIFLLYILFIYFTFLLLDSLFNIFHITPMSTNLLFLNLKLIFKNNFIFKYIMK